MDLTLDRKNAADTRRFALTTSSAVDPNGPVNAAEATQVVLWADVAFAFDVAATPAAVLPLGTTLGGRVWPANIPLRVHVPAGHRIAALAVAGTGFLVVMPGV